MPATADPDFTPGFSQRHDCAVILACDAAYLPYAAVPALQLAALPDRRFDVLIGSPQRVDLPASLAGAGIAAFGAVDPDLAGSLPGDARSDLARLGRDQALLNGILRGNWAEMSPLWNWQFTWASSHLLGMADPFVIHFIGPTKPWLAQSASVVPTRYRELYARLAPDIRPADLPAGLDRRHWPTARALRRALGRQWRAAGPMLDYLNRFPDPYALLDPRRVG